MERRVYYSIDQFPRLEKLLIGKIVVPTSQLYGIQPPSEYSQDKLQAAARLWQVGDPTIVEPLIVCALPMEFSKIAIENIVEDGLYRLTLIDGHHRARVGPKFGHFSVTCSLLPLGPLYKHLSEMDQNFKERFLTAKSYYEYLNAAIAQTLADFSRLMESKGKKPHNPLPLSGKEILLMLK